MPDPIHNPKCFASHMGTWMVWPDRAREMVAAIRSGLWQPHAHKPLSAIFAAAKVVEDPQYGGVLYAVDDNGIAVVQIQGAMAKAAGKYAATSSVQVRKALRVAAADQDVDAIMMVVDSPGGSVAGTQSLGDDVRAVDAVKPIHSHIDDLGASANYWVPSQARRVTANRTALVGSLGTYAVIEDSSKKAEMDGVEVHVLSTGPQKGAFVEGAPVTEKQLEAAQKTVNELNAVFIEAVAGGRRMSLDAAAALFTGDVWMAPEAKALGLLDGVMSLDQAMAELAQLVASKRPSPENARRMQLAKARR